MCQRTRVAHLYQISDDGGPTGGVDVGPFEDTVEGSLTPNIRCVHLSNRRNTGIMN